MSASLVGSEMCIRDRRMSARGTTREDLRRRAEWRPGKRRARSWWSLRAVSYTHLTLPTICSV
eukprot:10508793-Alexandrium_andersonii.AAC.1